MILSIHVGTFTPMFGYVVYLDGRTVQEVRALFLQGSLYQMVMGQGQGCAAEPEEENIPNRSKGNCRASCHSGWLDWSLKGKGKREQERKGYCYDN